MIHPVIPQELIEHLRALIDGANHIVITCHLSPDGDAMGSTMALNHVLRRLGKDAVVVTPDMVPHSLWFMPGIRYVVNYTRHRERAQQLINQAQLVVCLDFNALKRIDEMGEALMQCPAPRVLIDHHLNPEPLFDVAISFPEMTSTCELIFRVFMQLGWLRLIDRMTARCLYVGMMTDTGNFTYGNESAEVYEIVASLMRRNIDRNNLYKKALNTFSLSALRLQGFALYERMEVAQDKGAALIVLSKDDLSRFDYQKGDTEGLVNKPLAVDYLRVSIFLREDSDYVKVSCRSEGDLDVSEICSRYFGGGGHANAAGGEYHGSLEQAVALCRQIISELPNINENKSNQDEK